MLPKPKKMIRITVSEIAPPTGLSKRTIPATMLRTAENSSERNPGTAGAREYTIRVFMPAARNSQPSAIVISINRTGACGSLIEVHLMTMFLSGCGCHCHSTDPLQPRAC